MSGNECKCIGPHTEACQDERVRQVEAFWIREKQDKQNWRVRAEKAEAFIERNKVQLNKLIERSMEAERERDEARAALADYLRPAWDITIIEEADDG